MDGFMIAKNVQQLSEEREKLSVDLADKTDQIRELLQKNKLLKERLADLGYDANERVLPKGKMGTGESIRQSKSPVQQRFRSTGIR